MTDDEPERPVQVVLDEAISETIERLMGEWNFTTYEVVGVLTCIAARYAHTQIAHDD